ncbi:MAG: beta-ketoacyl-ACP synthase II [Parachlamydiaceae bacterium]|nr:beta-ketoacyl-ACP synthase II [Parachlamydiaceae bacterium]
MKKRIVITGMGVVSCFGNEVEQFYKHLLAGDSGVKTITSFPIDDFPVKIAAPIENFDCGDYLDKKQARRVDRNIAFTVVAGKKALESAGLGPEQRASLVPQRCGVLVGSGMGGMSVFVDGVETLHSKGPKRTSPFLIPYILPNMGSATLAIEIGFMGPNYSISTACATANNCILSAAAHIRAGEADLMICGGSEAAIIPLGMAGFSACKALSSRNDDPVRASRPWDKGRDGFVMGEGAGVLVIESLEHAQARGATILAELLGWGLSCDAHHMTEPHPEGEGVVQCLVGAFKNAEIVATDVNYINAHATSTPVGDVAEVRALKKVFHHPESIVMNSTKSMIGHSLGAAGGLEAVATIEAIRTGLVHPTINLDDPEEICAGFQLPTKMMPYQIKVAVSNSFGFGGHNATLVFAPFHE